MRYARAIALASALAFAFPASAIYGGSNAPEGAYPWMVHLFIGEPHEGIVCGASLIAPKYLLTAAHCVPNDVDALLGPNPLSGGESIEDYRALFGRVDLEAEGGEIVPAMASYRHPDAFPLVVNLPAGIASPSNDIAIVELAYPVSYPTIRVATSADVGLYPAGASSRVLGWGVTPEGTFPAHLQQVDVPVWSDEACGAALNYRVMFHPATEVCAGAAGMDSCGGDSGGPLFVRDTEGKPVQFGIVSYGAALEPNEDDPLASLAVCGGEEHPGVYTETAAFEDFVAAFLQ